MDFVISRLEKLAAEGLFGESQAVKVGPSSNDVKSAQFQSQLGFFEVELVLRKVPVVAKFQLDVVSVETKQLADKQFANEVVTYEKVLPELGASKLGLHPVMYFGYATKGERPREDLLVLEDLRPQGFKVPNEACLDSDHMKLALRRLGEFHGLSYKIKMASPKKFNDLKNLLTTKYVWDDEGYIKTSILRGFRELLQLNTENSVLTKAYKKLISLNSKELIERLSLPEEPFGVVVHGDFLKNNVLYKYDENGKPSSLKLFDFQTCMYSDPTVDLSVFMYMHTSEDRNDHWNNLLESYWAGLLTVGDPGFTFDQFSKNFAKKAVYGFIISAFFLPFMQHPENVFRFDRGFPDKPIEEKLELARNYGGEKSTRAISSIVRHLHDAGYLEEYLLNFDQGSFA